MSPHGRSVRTQTQKKRKSALRINGSGESTNADDCHRRRRRTTGWSGRGPRWLGPLGCAAALAAQPGVRRTLNGRGEVTEVAFAGQLTEADYRRLNALVARKVILGWSAALALLVAVQLWQWGWRAVLANPTSAAF